MGWDKLSGTGVSQKSSTLPGLHNLWLVLIQISSKFYPQNAYVVFFATVATKMP